ncbi:MAG: glutathione S-transferase family protein, partial [Rhodospirillales bacterium]|nr:glutathione S-transferase family protein [Rhodospirillales bacterium]
MAAATLLISSKNYSSWSLRGHLLARMAGLPFEEKVVSPDDPAMKAELLLQASSNRVPCLEHEGVLIWDVLAIAEYLNETFPKARMLPADKLARARCRSVSGEMHSGFSALRSSLPMNLRLHRPGFRLWSAAQADVDRIVEIWRECLTTWSGPWLFGAHPTIADAMYAPVVTRFRSYDVSLDVACDAYAKHVMTWEPLREWYAAA